MVLDLTQDKKDIYCVSNIKTYNRYIYLSAKFQLVLVFPLFLYMKKYINIDEDLFLL